MICTRGHPWLEAVRTIYTIYTIQKRVRVNESEPFTSTLEIEQSDISDSSVILAITNWY